MYVKYKADFNVFYSEFIRKGRKHFSEFAIKKIFEYLTMVEEHIGEEVEVEVHEIEKVWEEFRNITEYNARHGEEWSNEGELLASADNVYLLDNGNLLKGVF